LKLAEVLPRASATQPSGEANMDVRAQFPPARDFDERHAAGDGNW
jgi:hypothetical protein